MEIKIRNGICLIDKKDFDKISKHSWSAQSSSGVTYAYTRIGKSIISMHQFLAGNGIDHKNRNGLDNRRCNLRKCTPSQNNSNRIKLRLGKSTSKYKGVYFNGYSWVCVAWKNKKWHYGGSFEKEIDAALKYNQLAKKLHGEFALLNQVV